MNFKTPTAGNYTIAIDHTDGLFLNGQDIFLRDKLAIVEHDLKLAPYTFLSEAGNFSDRFELFYQTPLGIENPTVKLDNIIAYKQGGDIIISSNKAMTSVKVFDIRGRLLIEKSGLNTIELRIDGGLSEQVLMLRVTLENNVTIIKKIIN